MKNQADAKRRDVEFQPSGWVFLKLQLFWQTSLHGQHTHKLSKRLFRSFQITELIGSVAYRLVLPAPAQIHDVFHISKLKKCIGDPTVQHLPLPVNFQDQQPIFHPLAILCTRIILVQDKPIIQYLIQWEHGATTDATWENANNKRKNFLMFHLEDKVNAEGEAIVTIKDDQVKQMGREEDPIEKQSGRAYRTNKRLTCDTRFKDSITWWAVNLRTILWESV